MKRRLDDFLRYATQYERRDLARPYVAVPPARRSVGTTLSAEGLTCRHCRKTREASAPSSIPVALLGRLAVDVTVKGSAGGSLLTPCVGATLAERGCTQWRFAIDEDAKRFT
jgi:hypothetical protein